MYNGKQTDMMEEHRSTAVKLIIIYKKTAMPAAARI